MGVAQPTVCLLLLSAAACQAQLVYPLAGQEIGANGLKSVPSSGLSASPRLDVRVSALLDRVLAFDIMENTYDGTGFHATRSRTCIAMCEASSFGLCLLLQLPSTDDYPSRSRLVGDLNMGG